ncbi:MAG: EVE domain-containing protein [Silvanigrellales bacterium]|jgi:predicted RNA-binding protein with PUA-like domain|nr:EVE domain-containing protein [Silvanigrellales bacterium]
MTRLKTPSVSRPLRTVAEYLPCRNWLMKTEPDVFSFDALVALVATGAVGERWDGVRNYQARNLMRDEMRVGDRVLFYHSNAEPPGVVGVARVVEAASPDLSALNPASPYFDPKATPENPRWVCVTIGAPTRFPCYVPLERLREEPLLAGMLLVRPGQRLSVLPVDDEEFNVIARLGGLDLRASLLEKATPEKSKEYMP